MHLKFTNGMNNTVLLEKTSEHSKLSRNGWVEDTNLIPCLFESCLYPGEVDEANPQYLDRDE